MKRCSFIKNGITQYQQQRIKFYEDRIEIYRKEVAAARAGIIMIAITAVILIAASVWGG